MADQTDEQIIESFVQQGSDENATQPVTDEEVIEDFTDTTTKDEEGGDKGEGGDKEDEDEGDKGGSSVTQETIKFLERTNRKVAQGSDWLASLPTPGGIGLMLLAIVIILWTLIPTKSGYTRMQLIWMVLHDQVRLKGAQYPDESQNAFSVPTAAFTQPVVTNPVSLEIAQFAGGITGLPLTGTTGGIVTPLSIPDFSEPA